MLLFDHFKENRSLIDRMLKITNFNCSFNRNLCLAFISCHVFETSLKTFLFLQNYIIGISYIAIVQKEKILSHYRKCTD